VAFGGAAGCCGHRVSGFGVSQQSQQALGEGVADFADQKLFPID